MIFKKDLFISTDRVSLSLVTNGQYQADLGSCSHPLSAQLSNPTNMPHPELQTCIING